MPLIKGNSPKIVSKPSAAQLAYAAGIIDGEGSIGARKSYTCRASFGICVTVSMCDRVVPEFMASLFGGKFIESKRKTTTGKSIYCWSIYNRNATSALELMLPYLLIKRDRAIDTIVLQSMMRKRGGRGITKAVPDDEILTRSAIAKRISAANFAGNARVRRYAPN